MNSAGGWKGRVPSARTSNRTYRDPFGLATLLLLIGAAAYYFLFYGAFDVHDYYLVTMFLPLAFVTVNWMRVYGQLIPAPWWRRIAYPTLAILLLYGFWYTHGNLEKRFTEPHGDPPSERLFGIGDALTRMGVPTDAHVISIPDISPNISLYLAKRQGETDFYNRAITDLTPYVDWADYIIISRPEVIPELSRPVGQSAPPRHRFSSHPYRHAPI